MRSISIFILFAIVWSGVTAQTDTSPHNWRFGLRAGAFASTFYSNFEPKPEPHTTISFSGNQPAWRAGVQVQGWVSRKLGHHWAIQTALQLPLSSNRVRFSQTKNLITREGRNYVSRKDADFLLNTLDLRIPLLLNFETGQKIKYRFGIGPYLGINLDARQNGSYEQFLFLLDPNDPQIDNSWQVIRYEDNFLEDHGVVDLFLGGQAYGSVIFPAGDAFMEVMLEVSAAHTSIAFPGLQPVNIGLNLGYQFAGK